MSDITATESSTAITSHAESENDSAFLKKRGRISKQVTFSRPPFAVEVFTEETKKMFDSRPGYQRHFINQLLKTGDIKLAAQKANIAKQLTNEIDLKQYEQKSASEALGEFGLGVKDVIPHLHDCLKAETLMRDKHGNMHQGVDLKLKLATIELILKLHGVFDKKESNKPTGQGALDLFEHVDPKVEG